nr:EOG090X0B4J [Eurycercus lamellatus]
MALMSRQWLVVYVVLLAASAIHSSQPSYRSFHQDAAAEMNSGPEDLLLDELVRNWKWAIQKYPNRQRQHLVPEDEEEDVAYEEERQEEPKIPISPLQTQQQRHPFAYRPYEAGFGGNNGPRHVDPVIRFAAPAMAAPASDNDAHSVGQKERIFDDISAAVPEIQPEGKFSNDFKAMNPTHTSDDDSSSREPVAHAIISPAKSNSHHDSLADIYLTEVAFHVQYYIIEGSIKFAVTLRYTNYQVTSALYSQWQRRAKSAQDVEYPAYGITGPGPSPSGKSSLKSSPSSSTPGGIGGWGTKSPKLAASGDKKLAHSAHMFHFQHQKQQVIAMESHSGCDRRGSNSGGESDEDNEEGDYTVYECPGLAPTGEMEVKNPLFLDDPTPATPAAVKRQSE